MSVPAPGAVSATPFDCDTLRRIASERLTLDVPASATRLELPSAGGDHDLNHADPGPGETAQHAKRAAVLVAVVERDNIAHVIFTRRRDDLPIHAGQVSFPGGKIDPGDAGPVEAALREAHEEIGLEPEMADVIGLLDTYQTVTGYRVLPVIALIDPAFVARPEPAEVEMVFEVPLSFLMDPANHHRHERELRGSRRRFYAMPYQDHYIWGATAGMLRNMYHRLYAT